MKKKLTSFAATAKDRAAVRKGIREAEKGRGGRAKIGFVGLAIQLLIPLQQRQNFSTLALAF